MTLTNELAIDKLRSMLTIHVDNKSDYEQNEALLMGISALNSMAYYDRNMADWNIISNRSVYQEYYCSNCDHVEKHEYPFCPVCGAYMRNGIKKNY